MPVLSIPVVASGGGITRSELERRRHFLGRLKPQGGTRCAPTADGFSPFFETAIRVPCLLGARRAQYQASRNQNQNQNQNQIHGSESRAGAGAGAGSAGTDINALVRRSMADERALEEAAACAGMGLLFVGVNS